MSAAGSAAAPSDHLRPLALPQPPTVPVGVYARRVLGGVSLGRHILANVRSEEPDVAGIVVECLQFLGQPYGFYLQS